MQRKKKAKAAPTRAKRARKSGATRKVTKRKPTVKRAVVARKAKYKVGDFVYSSFNPTEKRQISAVRIPKTKAALISYQLTLSDPCGKPKKSKWIAEGRLRKTKKV